MNDFLVLVDEDDNIVGYREKEHCHRTPAKRHRAFSIFIFNSKREMLIQRRSHMKKTWPGFWTNACCSHPSKNELLQTATRRRLREELGFEIPVTFLFKFSYESDYDKEYGENEIDHVFVGIYDGKIKPNRDEIADWRFVTIEALSAEVQTSPGEFTPWFRKALPHVLKRARQELK